MLIRGSCWLAFDVAILTSSFGLFYSKVQYHQHAVPMVKNCKHVSFRGFRQPMFFQWVQAFIVNSEWLFRSSKPCVGRVFVAVLFLCCHHSAIFKLQYAMDVRRKRTTYLVFHAILFFRGLFVSYCRSFVPGFVFLQTCDTCLSVFITKEILYINHRIMEGDIVSGP